MKVRTPATRYPWRVEEMYQKKLHSLINLLHDGILRYLKTRRHLVSHDDDFYQQGDLFNQANPDDEEEFRKQLDEFIQQASVVYGGDLAKKMVEQMIRGAESMASNMVNEQLRANNKIQNVEVSADEIKLLQAKAAENMSYISSIGSEYLNKVQDAILRGMTNGSLTSKVADDIMKITDVSQKRANLIARDQTSKVFGQLTKYKQTKAHITHFRWSTALDERVRPRHQALEGKIFTWENGWDGIFPGDEINCRCVADPVFEDELDEADPDDFFDKPQAPEFNDVSEGGILKKDKNAKERVRFPDEANPGSVYMLIDEDNSFIQKRYFGDNKKAIKDIDYTDHGNPKRHPIVPHAHDWNWNVQGNPRGEPRRLKDGEV